VRGFRIQTISFSLSVACFCGETNTVRLHVRVVMRPWRGEPLPWFGYNVVSYHRHVSRRTRDGVGKHAVALLALLEASVSTPAHLLIPVALP